MEREGSEQQRDTRWRGGERERERESVKGLGIGGGRRKGKGLHARRRMDSLQGSR